MGSRGLCVRVRPPHTIERRGVRGVELLSPKGMRQPAGPIEIRDSKPLPSPKLGATAVGSSSCPLLLARPSPPRQPPCSIGPRQAAASTGTMRGEAGLPRRVTPIGGPGTLRRRGGGGGGGGVYSYSADTIEGPRAPTVKLTARHSSLTESSE